MNKVAPSLACADVFHFQQDLDLMIAAGADLLHFDIMDGQFVSNFGMNFDVLKRIKQHTSVPVDVHLMVQNGDKYIDRLTDLGADYITLHYEAVTHPIRAMRSIRKAGSKAGIAISPAIDPGCLKYMIDEIDLVVAMSVDPGFAGQTIIPSVFGKIKEIRALIQQSGNQVDLAVDGNVSEEYGRKMVQCGANVLVLGSSSLFGPGGQKDYPAIIEKFKRLGL